MAGSVSMSRDALGWTPLPPLQLRGVESGLVESLNHYAQRMAHICGITRDRLVRVLKRHRGLPHRERGGQQVSSWTGPSSDYASLLFPLMELTGQQDLFKGTFHCVSGVLGRGGLATMSEKVNRHRWCPKCYLDWDDDVSYEPLVWAFSMLTACPTHGVLMEGRCTHCGLEQNALSRYSHRRICRVCKQSLAWIGSRAPADPSQEWVDSTLAKFTQFSASLDAVLPFSVYTEFLDGMRERLRSGEAFPPAIRQFVSQRIDSSKLALPTIAQYLNFCAFQGCEIEEMMTSPRSAASRPLFDRGAGFATIPFKRRAIASNIVSIGLCMERLLASNDLLLPSTGLLCRQFGVWADVVRDRLPDLHRLYIERYVAQSVVLPTPHVRRGFEAVLHAIRKSDSREHEEDIVKMVSSQATVPLELAAKCLSTARIVKESRGAGREGHGTWPESSGFEAWERGAYK